MPAAICSGNGLNSRVSDLWPDKAGFELQEEVQRKPGTILEFTHARHVTLAILCHTSRTLCYCRQERRIVVVNQVKQVICVIVAEITGLIPIESAVKEELHCA